MEIPVPLHEAEAFELTHGERRGERLARVDERTPDPLAVAGRDHESVGVVHFGAEVRAMGLILTERIHAREGRDAERGDLAAQEQAHAHVHHGLGAGMNIELVGAARAR